MKPIPLPWAGPASHRAFRHATAKARRRARRICGPCSLSTWALGLGIGPLALSFCVGGGLALLFALGTRGEGVARSFTGPNPADATLRVTATRSRAVSGSPI